MFITFQNNHHDYHDNLGVSVSVSVSDSDSDSRYILLEKFTACERTQERAQKHKIRSQPEK